MYTLRTPSLDCLIAADTFVRSVWLAFLNWCKCSTSYEYYHRIIIWVQANTNVYGFPKICVCNCVLRASILCHDRRVNTKWVWVRMGFVWLCSEQKFSSSENRSTTSNVMWDDYRRRNRLMRPIRAICVRVCQNKI